MTTRSVLFGVARAFLGFIFLWAFLDKTFGFGLATKAADAWIRGGSPTTGFLSHAVTGPLAGVFHSLAGSAVVDWLFMAGLLFVGLTLLANRFVRWGSVVGIGMLALMYLALLWPANNPFIDEHLVYIVLLGLIAVEAKHS
jgi:thiosulfate dehydrogenase [quinone] large subunit